MSVNIRNITVEFNLISVHKIIKSTLNQTLYVRVCPNDMHMHVHVKICAYMRMHAHVHAHVHYNKDFAAFYVF